MRILGKTGAAVGLILCLTSAPVWAEGWESLPALEQQLQQFLGKQLGETGGARHGIDRRLKLTKCPVSPVIEMRNEGLAIIRCEPLNWRIPVPLVREDGADRGTSSAEVLVKRGQAVLLVVEKSGFTISRQMHADRSGGMGDIIPVRRARRSQPIMAEITGEGRVTLPAY